jgi:hypothetical protein
MIFLVCGWSRSITIRDIVELPGEIVGNNWQVRCRVSATRVHHPGVPGIFGYAKVEIVSAAQEVPNGIYQLRFGNYSARVMKVAEGWREAQ